MSTQFEICRMKSSVDGDGDGLQNYVNAFNTTEMVNLIYVPL